MWRSFDRLTLFGLLGAAVTSSAVTGLGAALPFLRQELTLTYTQSGMHSSAYALGVIVAGLYGDRLVARLGTRTTLRWSCVGLSFGFTSLALARHPQLTLASSLVMGLMAALVSTLVITSFSARPAEERRLAYTRLSFVGCLAAGCLPLVVGVAERHGASWRVLPGLGLLGLATLLAWSFREPSLLPESGTLASSGTLPVAYWFCWTLLLLGISVEFCTIFWAATFVETRLQVAPEDAAGAVTLFLMAMLIGRGLGGVVLARWPARGVLMGTILLASTGFLAYWLGSGPAVVLTGLFLTGLGLANLYPLLVSMAMTAAGEQAPAASARITLAAGSAILLAPFVLAALGEQYGLARAHAFVALLLLALAGGALGSPFFIGARES